MAKVARKYALGYTLAGIAWNKADATKKVAALKKKGLKVKLSKKASDGSYTILAK